MNIDKTQYEQGAKDDLVPLTDIRETDLLHNELAQEIVAKAHAVQNNLTASKREVMDDIAVFVQLSANRYNVSIGGKEGSISLHSLDGTCRVNFTMRDTLVFDKGLPAAKTLIDECINEWTEGSRTELKTLINAAFQVDKEGDISTTHVLGLRRLRIMDEKQQRVMDTLSNSLQVHISRPFVRVYQHGEDEEYQLMSLDVAKI